MDLKLQHKFKVLLEPRKYRCHVIEQSILKMICPRAFLYLKCLKNETGGDIGSHK